MIHLLLARLLAVLLVALPGGAPNLPSIWQPLGSMTITVYQLVPEQTDDSPRVFADGSTADQLANTKVCAASRDLLSRWGGPIDYGDTVLIAGSPALRLCEVHDTMATHVWRSGAWQPIQRHIDVLTNDLYGKWTAPVYHPHDMPSVADPDRSVRRPRRR